MGTINLIRVSSPADVECNDRLLLVASFVKSVYLNVHCFADWKWFVWNVARNYLLKKLKAINSPKLVSVVVLFRQVELVLVLANDFDVERTTVVLFAVIPVDSFQL